MTSAAIDASYDYTALPHVVRSGIKLGLIQGALIALFAVLQVRLDGAAETVVCGLILLIGIAATILLPGRWTRARTIEGIAGAAGIGFGSAITFLVLDVTIFQPVHLYTNRWLEIGGGSNWWYHPVWWMVGTYLTWMGAWVQANQTAKNGQTSPVVQVMITLILSMVFLAIGILIGVPNAGWNLGSFSVAVLPALALYTALTSIGVKRR